MISCETPQIQMRMDISVNFAVCGSVSGVSKCIVEICILQNKSAF